MTLLSNILVVDDEPSLVELCRIILEQAGYKVRGAYNGSQALSMVTEDTPDLVLLDVMMPGMDGIEVCRRIRTEHEKPPPCIVMYTADERDETRDNSITAGATDVLTKETPVFDLPKRIGDYLATGCA